MTEKVVRIREFGEHDEVRENLAYWLSRPPGERIAEVERLRRCTMETSDDFREWFALLNANRVEYMVADGYALAFHGAPRFTGAIDVFVRPEGRSRIRRRGRAAQ